MVSGSTQKKVIESLQFYFCNSTKPKTIGYNDIYEYFDDKHVKIGKSRVREIVIDLQEKGILCPIEPKKTQRGRPIKQINLNPESKTILESMK